MKKLAFLLLILLVFCAIPCTSYAEAPKSCSNPECLTPIFNEEPDNHIDSTCNVNGWDEYVCQSCHTTNRVFLPLTDHTPGTPRKEQKTYSTYKVHGTYDMVTRCTECEAILSTETGEDPLLTVNSITVNLSTNSIKVGERTTATAVVLPEADDAPTVVWTASDNVMIDNSGNILAVSEGIAGIKAEAGGKSDIASLTITPKEDPEETYTLTVTSTAGGTVSAGGTHAKGTRVEISATPDTGYVFSGWQIGTATIYDRITTVTMNDDVTAHAVFTRSPTATCHVTVTYGIGGTATGDRDYPAGSTATVTATPDSEYNFSRWEIGSAIFYSNPCSFVVNEDVEAVAVFSRKPDLYTITYMPGTDCPTGSIYTDSVGSAAYLREQTYLKSGYTQTGWSLTQGGAKAYDLRQSITIDKSMVLYPYWTKNVGTLKLTVNYSGEGVVYLNGAKVTSGAVYDISELQSYTFQMMPNSKDYYVYSINLAGKYWNANVDTDKFMVKYDMMQAENRTLTIKFDSVTAPPKTGDSSNILLWSCLFGLSAAAVTTGMVLKKKSKS